MSRQIVKCDLCYVRLPPAIVWHYDIEPFFIKGEPGQPDYQDDGTWALCDTCHTLVDRKSWNALFNYIFEMDSPSSAADERWRRRLVGLFGRAKRIRPPYQGYQYLFTDGETQHG